MLSHIIWECSHRIAPQDTSQQRSENDSTIDIDSMAKTPQLCNNIQIRRHISKPESPPLAPHPILFPDASAQCPSQRRDTLTLPTEPSLSQLLNRHSNYLKIEYRTSQSKSTCHIE